MKTAVVACTLVVLGFASAVRAEGPEDWAARCVARVEGLVDRCENAVADDTRQCVREIQALLEAGRVNAARQTARECLQSGHDRAERCAELIRRVCNVCIDELLDAGAIELARRVENACDDAISRLRHMLQRQENIILGALGA